MAAFFFACTGARAQAVLQQLGPITKNHLIMGVQNGGAMDAGGPAQANGPPQNNVNPGTLPSGLGIVNSGLGDCQFSAFASGPYAQFCWGFDGAGNALLSISGNGGAPAPAFNVNINGTTYPWSAGTGNMSAPTSPPLVNGDPVLSNGGTLTRDGGPRDAVSVMDSAYGAKCDGATNDAVPIQNAINAVSTTGGGAALIPSKTCLTAAAISVPAGVILRGASFVPGNPPGGSILECAASVSPCVTISGGAGLGTAGIANLTVEGAAGTPSAGSIGVLWNGGYNSWAANVLIDNFDTCAKWFSSGTAGIGFHAWHLNSAQCASHFYTFDGWPEADFVGGRAGENGAGDYASTQDFVLFENSACASGGCGPNTITFTDYQFNPGSNGPACAIRWANFVNPTSSAIGSEMRFNHDHIEWHTAGTGVICSDSSATQINQLYFDHNEAVTNSSTPFFALNPATAINQWFFDDNILGGCSAIALSPNPASGKAMDDVYFTNNFGCNSASFTSNGAGPNTLFLSANDWGSTLTLAGAWFQLTSQGDQYAALADTATGHVGLSSPSVQSWTPALKFGGASTGITYTTDFGQVTRTLSGGFRATFDIGLSAVGTATGTATITGLPYTCANGAVAFGGGTALGYFAGMASMQGDVIANLGTSSPAPIQLYQIAGTLGSSSGLGVLTNSNFTNASALIGTVSCAQTQ